MIDILREFGFPVAIVVALTWFLFKKLWPWMTAQTERAQAQAENAVNALGELKTVLGDQGSINKQVLEELKEMNRRRISDASSRKR